MATKSTVEEPQVTVRNIPQSSYNQAVSPVTGQPAAVPAQQGGLIGNIKQHWPVWTVGIAAATLFIMWLIYRNNNSAAAQAAQSNQYGYGTGNSSPDQLWGSQLDADYQQLASIQNTNTGILQQILNTLQNPSTSPPSGGGTPPPPNPSHNNPLIPLGQLPTGTKYAFGQDLTWGGQEYELGPGSNGVLWGVPISGGKNLNLATWNQVPIGGTGGKVVIYGPPSMYH